MRELRRGVRVARDPLATQGSQRQLPPHHVTGRFRVDVQERRLAMGARARAAEGADARMILTTALLAGTYIVLVLLLDP